MTLPTAPQGGVPFVDEDRTPSNSALIFLQQLRNAVVSVSGGGGGGGGATVFPLTAPNGSASVPSYSWMPELNTGFYRVTTGDIRFSIAGVDAVRFTPNTIDDGFGVVIADQTTFFYPTGTGGGAAHGRTIKANRIQVGVEALQGTQGAQSPVSWVNTYQPALMELASIGVTSQIGGAPIGAATRTSDYHTAIGGTTGGAGSYFFALNDDTTVGSGGDPIAAALNATVWRASGVTGVSEALQNDVENLGTVVDNDPYTAYTAGTTLGMNITCGAFSGSTNQATVALILGTGGGPNAKFRKGIICTNLTLDPALGVAGGGLFAELPRGASIRWTNSGHTADTELWGGPGGLFINTPIWPAQLGIPGASGFGGTVSQITNITTAVSLNKITGTITTVSNAFTTGTIVQFTVNNTLVAANDVVIVSSQTVNMLAFANSVAANSFVIALDPLANATTTVLINFVVIKGAIN